MLSSAWLKWVCKAWVWRNESRLGVRVITAASRLYLNWQRNEKTDQIEWRLWWAWLRLSQQIWQQNWPETPVCPNRRLICLGWLKLHCLRTAFSCFPHDSALREGWHHSQHGAIVVQTNSFCSASEHPQPPADHKAITWKSRAPDNVPKEGSMENSNDWTLLVKSFSAYQYSMHLTGEDWEEEFHLSSAANCVGLLHDFRESKNSWWCTLIHYIARVIKVGMNCVSYLLMDWNTYQVVRSSLTYRHEVLKVMLVVKTSLSLLTDVEDCLYSGHRIFAPQCFCPQKNSICSIQNSICHISCLCPTETPDTLGGIW